MFLLDAAARQTGEHLDREHAHVFLAIVPLQIQSTATCTWLYVVHHTVASSWINLNMLKDTGCTRFDLLQHFLMLSSTRLGMRRSTSVHEAYGPLVAMAQTIVRLIHGECRELLDVCDNSDPTLCRTLHRNVTSLSHSQTKEMESAWKIRPGTAIHLPRLALIVNCTPLILINRKGA